MVPHRREFEIEQSFVYVGLHVLPKELHALIVIFLSGDLGAVSSQGESVVCRVGSSRKAGWQHQLQAVPPRNAPCRAKKQGQSPALGAGGLAGTADSARVQTRTQQSLVQPQEIPRANSSCCWKRLPRGAARGSPLHHPPGSVSLHPQTCWDLLSSHLPQAAFPTELQWYQY